MAIVENEINERQETEANISTIMLNGSYANVPHSFQRTIFV